MNALIHKFVTITEGNIQTGDQFRWTKEFKGNRPKYKRYWKALHMHSGLIGMSIKSFTHYEFRRLTRRDNRA